MALKDINAQMPGMAAIKATIVPAHWPIVSKSMNPPCGGCWLSGETHQSSHGDLTRGSDGL